MNKKRKSHTKLKLLSIAALIFGLGVATSVTATYAWFSLNEQTRVENLNMRFSSNPLTLELGVWDESINDVNFDLESYSNKDLKDDEEEEKLKDVSGMFESEWLNDGITSEVKKSREFLPCFQAPYRGTTSTTKTRFATEGFIQHEFYLRASNPCSIYLDKSSYVVPNIKNNMATANELGTTLEELNKVVDAARVSFFTYDSYTILNPYQESTTPYDTYYGGIMDYNDDGYYDYRDDKEILYGEWEGNVVYKDNDLPEETLQKRDIFHAYHKEGVQIIDFEKSDVTIKKEIATPFNDMILDEEAADMDISPITTLKAGEAKRIVVSIYLEGWDVNMTSSLYSASFDINVAFAALFNI